MATYAGVYSEHLQDRYGNGYRNALVAVQTLAAAPVTLYADRDKTAYVPASGLEANEIKADSRGNLRFFADPGNYQIVVTPSGGSTLAAFPVSVLPDPLEPDASEGALAAEQAARIAADDALTTSVAGKVSKADNLSDLADAALARGNIGLGNVANLAPADLPVSTAQAAAIAAEASARAAAILAAGGTFYQAVNGQITTLEAVGHSFMSAALSNKIAADLGAASLNTAVGGQTLLQSLQNNLYLAGAGTLRRLAGETPHDLTLAMWGINDIAALGVTPTAYTFGQRFGLALRMALSRMRTAPGNAYNAGAAEFSFGAGWAALSNGNRTATSGSPTYTWTSPAGFLGGWVAIWILATQGTGATHTFTLDGVAAGALTTVGLVAPAPAPAHTVPTCFRIWVPAGVGHVLACTVTGITTITYVSGWQVERAVPQPILFLKAPRALSYSAYAASFHTPTDENVADLNAAIEATCAEFDQWVVPVDLDGVMAKSTALFAGDLLHPTTAGISVMATVIRKAIEDHPGLTTRAGLVA